MWRISHQLRDGVEHRYTNDFFRIDIRRFKGSERLFLIYYPDVDTFTIQRRLPCGCLNGSETVFISKFIRRRSYKKLTPDERFNLVKQAIAERVRLEGAITSPTIIPYRCEECSCSRCSNYLEQCECRCPENHLMKECSCICPYCTKTLTKCECWCDWCGDSYFSDEHRYTCEQDEDDDCGCCPCCGCTCDEWHDDEDELENEPDEAQTSPNE